MKLKFAVSLALLGGFIWLGAHSFTPVVQSSWAESEENDGRKAKKGHEFRFSSVSTNEAISQATVTLVGPGGRVSAGRTNGAGLFDMSQTIYDDFPYLLRVSHPGFESAEWRLRGAWLNILGRPTLQLQECGRRRAIVVCYEAMPKAQVTTHWRWQQELQGLGPPGGQGVQVIPPAPGERHVVIANVPYGARLVISAIDHRSGAGDRVDLVVPGDEQEDPLVIHRRLRATSLRGRVESLSGHALMNANVRFLAPEELGDMPTLTAISDELGMYQMDLPCWLIEKTKDGQEFGRCDVDLAGVLYPGLPLIFDKDQIRSLTLPTSTR